MSWIRTRRPRVLAALLLAGTMGTLIAAMLMATPAVGERVRAMAGQVGVGLTERPEPSPSVVVAEFDSLSRTGGLQWYRSPMYWTGVIQSAEASRAAALVIDESFSEPFLGGFVANADDLAASELSPQEQELLRVISDSPVPLILTAQEQSDGSHLVPFAGIARESAPEPYLLLDDPMLAASDRGHSSHGRMSSYRYGPSTVEIDGESVEIPSIPIAVAEALGVDADELSEVPDVAPLTWYGPGGSMQTEASITMSGGAQLVTIEDKVVVFGGANDGRSETFATIAGDSVPSAEIQATAISNLLQGQYKIAAPGWTGYAAGIALAAIAWLALVTLPAAFGWPVLIAVFASWLGASLWLSSTGLVVDAATGLVLGMGGALATGTALMVSAVRDRLRIKGMFARYVSPDVVNELADSDDPIRLGGEAREITVLFADIRGFTSLSEHADPEEMVNELNTYFAQMVQVITSHGGTLDKFLGDGLMAIFGAPTHQDDHAARGVRAALAMLESLDELNRVREVNGKAPLRIGIGVHTGTAVVGNIGSPLFRVDFTAIGDTVNLASRLEGATKEAGCQVLASGATAAAAGDELAFHPRGSIIVKGRTASTDIFEPLPDGAEVPAADLDSAAG